MLGDPSSDQEKAALEACKLLHMDSGREADVAHDHVLPAHETLNKRLGDGASLENSPAEATADGAPESPNAQNGSALSVDVARRRSTAHFALQDASRAESMMVEPRTGRQSVRSVMQRNPPRGTWLVVIDDQVEPCAMNLIAVHRVILCMKDLRAVPALV